MRAVNLIPAEQRRGAGGIAGRSGGIAYVLTGGLAVLVVLGIVYALAVHTVADRNGQLATVSQQVATVTEQAQALAPYVEVAQLSAAKVAEVTTLAQSRFNWPGAMRQLALALPSDVTLNSFSASVPSDGSGVTTTSFSLNGCANSQSEVATVLTSLAAVPGVSVVSLTNTTKNADAKNGAVATASGGCPYVTFALAVTYDPSYTVPNVKSAGSPSTAQTVSSSSTVPTIKTAASQQSTGVAP